MVDLSEDGVTSSFYSSRSSFSSTPQWESEEVRPSSPTSSYSSTPPWASEEVSPSSPTSSYSSTPQWASEEVSPSSPSSSFSATPQWEYDVFLSFRGEDTRMNFTDHLYTTLIEKGINNTFRDEEALEKGKPISELFKAIEESRCAVIVFSENYADSTWCLDEAAKIVECMKKKEMIVLPVFYHVNPSDVRHQTGTFAKAFTEETCKRKICSMEKEETWRAALREVGKLNGWHLQGNSHEAMVIREIVEEIFVKLRDKTKGAELPTTTLVGKEFRRNLRKIWQILMKDDVSSIGIHGMGGVGKTTLVKHINNRLQKELDSFTICWITVSRDLNINRLQNDIAKTLNLPLSDEDDEMIRAAKLQQALTTRKKLILILDDVWKFFDIKKVGVHVKVNGCKLILTTRFLDVCRRMGCQENVGVVPLQEDEAWNLFKEKFEHDIEALPLEIGHIGRSIAKECAGLPLGIIVVAGCMRGMGIDIHGWRNALEELKHSKVSEVGLGDMEDEVFRVLKFSYSNLKDPKLQECFLNCSLYPEDFKIGSDELIEHLIDEGIIERMQSRQAEFDKGHAMLTKLENAYLLEGGKLANGKFVKMHDLLRDMAIQIARATHGFMVEAGKGLQDLPLEEKWKDVLVKVSLMSNKFSKIDSNASPMCPKLSTLMLNYNKLLGGIANSFFTHMPGLKVLNLSYSGIEYLPDSICNLENLTALVLDHCDKLKDVPSLAKLTTLRRLDLVMTRIKKIPQGLEMLVNLRYLNLRGHYNIFPTGIFPKLAHLQYLKFYSSSKKLKVEVEEIARLMKLEIFEIKLYKIHDFNTYVRSLEEERGPRNYVVQVGINPPSKAHVSSRIDKEVKLIKCSISKSRGGEDSLVLPKDVQSLQLIEICGLTSLCDVPSFNNAVELKELCVERCKEMNYILSSSSFSSCSLPLQSLESVSFHQLDNLDVLIREERAGSSPVPPGTFSRLKHFHISHCPNIKKLFTSELLLCLQNLEDINVNKCEELVEIFEEEEEDDNERNKEEGMHTTIISLPKLRKLTFRNLGNLKRSKVVIVCESIQLISINKCSMLETRMSLLLRDGRNPRNKIKVDNKIGRVTFSQWDNPYSEIVLQPLPYV